MQSVPYLNDTLTVAGMTIPRSNVLSLFGKTNTGGSNGNCSVRKPNGTAGYQVPVGKQFRILAVKVHVSTGESFAPTFCYSDNDLSFSTGNAATNPVYLAGNANAFPLYGGSSGTVQELAIPGGFVVPAGKYISYLGTGAAANIVEVFGVEENA